MNFLSILFFLWLAIGGSILTILFADDLAREEFFAMSCRTRALYVGVILFLWPVIVWPVD